MLDGSMNTRCFFFVIFNFTIYIQYYYLIIYVHSNVSMLLLAYTNSCNPEETARPMRPDFDKAALSQSEI